MKLYRTKENTVINLDGVTMIFKNTGGEGYHVAFNNGVHYDVPELTEEDIDKIMSYNDYFIQ